MSLQPLPNWQGWLAHYGYPDADPFTRPLPIPSMGIFDSPDVTICFNSKWSPILLGALSRLVYPELYIIDGQHDGIWAQNEAQKLMGVIAGAQNPCLPQSIMETQCAYYPSWYAGIEYIPHNPFDPSSEFDPQYPVAPFFRFASIDTWFPDWLDDWFFGAVENITGYRENDVFVSFFSVPTYQNPFDGLDYPTIKITVQGTGTVKLKFLLVPFGGRALISFDPVGVFDILTAIFTTEDRIIELNRDLLALVPETDVDAIEELQLTEDTTHEIYITFLPTINDEAPIFQFGGGFRGYEVCGDLTVIDPFTGEPIDLENPTYQDGVIVTTLGDIREGNRLAMMDIASQILSGQVGNISAPVTINTDGTNTISEDSTANVGVIGTASEKYNGGAYEAYGGINEFIADFASFYTITGADAAQMELFMTSKWLLNASISSAITDYIAYRQIPQQAPALFGSGIIEKYFCGGVKKQSTANWIIEELQQNQSLLLTMVNALSDDQYSQWVAEGAKQPRTDYLSYACTLRADNNLQILDLTANLAQYVDLFGYENTTTNRLIRITVSGKFVDSGTGNEIDIKFIKASNGDLSDAGWLAFGFADIGSANFMIMPPTELPYSENNVYQWTAQIVPDEYDGFVYKPANLAWISTASGQIDVLVEDLGEV